MQMTGRINLRMKSVSTFCFCLNDERKVEIYSVQIILYFKYSLIKTFETIPKKNTNITFSNSTTVAFM